MNKLKTILLGVFFVLASTISFAQDSQLIRPGTYTGSIVENNTTRKYSIEFDADGYAYQLDEYGTRMTFKFKQTSSHGQVTTLEWINSGGTWTETQIFIITKLSNDVIQVFHLRYVVNEGSETESWYYGNKGNLYLED